MYTQHVVVDSEVGLHARPATYFIQTASHYKCSIWVEYEEQRVSAKSLLGILSLGVEKGAEITISANGADEKKAVDDLVDLIDCNFEE